MRKIRLRSMLRVVIALEVVQHQNEILLWRYDSIILSNDTTERGQARFFLISGFFKALKKPSSPYINRFLQPDTIIPGTTNPQSWNRFSYVLNNPIRLTDPSGHRACDSDEECNELGITRSGRELTYNQIMKKLKHPKVKSPKDMEISDKGLDFIMKWEGFEGGLYNDPGGHCTIGYGHLVHKGSCNGDDSEQIFTDGLSKEDAQSLLRTDVMVAEEAVRDLVKVDLTQSQFDALVSLVFNWGKGNLGKSPKLTMLNSDLYFETGQHFNVGPITSNGVVQPGLVTRRYQESQMFLYGP